MNAKDFFRVKQVAELLGVAPNTVRAWGASGKLIEYRHPVNNYRLYKKKDLMVLLKKLEKPVT
jgi:DNA (cytosine-5)-methyltransferase 1